MFHIGQDGWLFLTGGSNDVVAQYGNGRAIWARLLAWRRLALARAARAEALGARYLHVVVPEKITVYDHKFAGLRVDVRRSPARRLARLLSLTPAGRAIVVDLVAPMRAQRDAADLYYRTDTHWAFPGYFLAYREICRACGGAARENFTLRPSYLSAEVMDIEAKLPFPEPERARRHVLQQDAVREPGTLVRAYEAAGRGLDLHVGAHVVFRNPSPQADPRRVVLFGSSCSGHVHGMLSGALAETFRELHFVWSANIDWAYVEAVRPDLVLFEIAERFMARVPTDDFSIEAFAAERIRALRDETV
ncbi:alginate O-acetyltransferase AlgX-related protein [Methylobacterium oryzisoli]|uniref:alginate O-acetyltransferase AlgX-related protein n=1 Tax=Methylobacterium oryzisoli TaxID=3385502 RepID=UPI003891BE31